MKYCKACRNPLPKRSEGTKHCVYCGRPVPRSLAWVVWVCALLVTTIAVGLVAYLLLHLGGSGQPDLVIQDVALSPAEPTAGEETIFSVTLKNQGNGRSSASEVSLYVDGSLKDSKDADPVAGGGTTTLTLRWLAQRGSHTVKVAADPGNSIVETDDTNNQRGLDLEEVSVIVQFHLTGTGACDWYAVCRNGAASRSEGIATCSYITVTLSAEDWAAIKRHELDPTAAWSAGRVTIDGDMMLLLQLASSIYKAS